ncbi:MAG: pyruvate carboxyltransferase [Acidobacteriia bacterium]|nr:pyruvate carboxyltransferase [Terriglobia bacterium]
MSQEPWKTDKWFVSPWNFDEAVRSEFHFPKQIKIHDITLRDGEQQTGVIFTKDDKIRIAEGLAEAGVHRIEAGMPVVSPSDQAAITEIVKRNLGPQIFAFSRCMVDDVKRAVDCGVSGVVMEVPSSQHIIQYAYQWPLERAIQLSIESTAYAHQQGLEVVFFPIDFTRADMKWVLDLILRVANEGHMDALALVDTFGVVSPHAMQYLVRQVKARIDKRLEAHFHMDFGMGVANTIMAVAEGVEVIHSTVLGLGERAGNTPMEETVMALLTLYGIDIGINCEKLYGLARLVQELSGHAVPSNRPVVGDALFQIESGIIASWFQNCGADQPTELFPYRPELVGQPAAKVVLGKGSGIDSIKTALKNMGVTASDDEALQVVAAVKEFSLERKRLLTPEEFRSIVARTLPSKADAAQAYSSVT